MRRELNQRVVVLLRHRRRARALERRDRGLAQRRVEESAPDESGDVDDAAHQRGQEHRRVRLQERLRWRGRGSVVVIVDGFFIPLFFRLFGVGDGDFLDDFFPAPVRLRLDERAARVDVPAAAIVRCCCGGGEK